MGGQGPEMLRGPGTGRCVRLSRRTRETLVEVYLNVDGTGGRNVSTGFPFLDHCIESLALHAAFDIELTVCAARPDLHHCAEDAGWALGVALRRCLSSREDGEEAPVEAADARGEPPSSAHGTDKASRAGAPIRRFGWAAVPFDEVLVFVSVDLIGRPGFYLSPEDGLDFDDVQEFFKAFAAGSGATVHVLVQRGGNRHHKLECSFKALGRALRDAVMPDARLTEESVKGRVEYQTGDDKPAGRPKTP